ncbi:MAG TPA: hypothetical protein VNJ08_04710 [Bacteriovoracaceae bacterium]|nr:hypothetical protein [Bacteriovoracaceae bacterium]
MNLQILLLVSLIFFSCSHRDKNGDLPLPGSLEEAVSSNSRAPENEERDHYQHPVETLKFFGLKPEMTVAHISPGAGYYTEILAPYLAAKGQYVMVVPRLPSNPPAFLIENEKKLQDILLSHKDIQTKTRFVPFEPLNKRTNAKPGFADLVLTFNTVHNWVADNSVSFSFKFFYELLKPGGTLGVVQHRIKDGQKNYPKSGYLTEKAVIAIAQSAGFIYTGAKSEINANPKDKADYPKGVWVLPPTYRLGDQDRDKYEDIGESDRMTLKFEKPRK